MSASTLAPTPTLVPWHSSPFVDFFVAPTVHITSPFNLLAKAHEQLAATAGELEHIKTEVASNRLLWNLHQANDQVSKYKETVIKLREQIKQLKEDPNRMIPMPEIPDPPPPKPKPERQKPSPRPKTPQQPFIVTLSQPRDDWDELENKTRQRDSNDGLLLRRTLSFDPDASWESPKSTPSKAGVVVLRPVSTDYDALDKYKREFESRTIPETKLRSTWQPEEILQHQSHAPATNFEETVFQLKALLPSDATLQAICTATGIASSGDTQRFWSELVQKLQANQQKLVELAKSSLILEESVRQLQTNQLTQEREIQKLRTELKDERAKSPTPEQVETLRRLAVPSNSHSASTLNSTSTLNPLWIDVISTLQLYTAEIARLPSHAELASICELVGVQSTTFKWGDVVNVLQTYPTPKQQQQIRLLVSETSVQLWETVVTELENSKRFVPPTNCMPLLHDMNVLSTDGHVVWPTLVNSLTTGHSAQERLKQMPSQSQTAELLRLAKPFVQPTDQCEWDTIVRVIANPPEVHTPPRAQTPTVQPDQPQTPTTQPLTPTQPHTPSTPARSPYSKLYGPQEVLEAQDNRLTSKLHVLKVQEVACKQTSSVNKTPSKIRDATNSSQISRPSQTSAFHPVLLILLGVILALVAERSGFVGMTLQ